MLTCFSVFLGALGGSWAFRAPVLLCLGSPLVVRSRVSKFFTAFFPLFIFHYESPPLIFACPDLFYSTVLRSIPLPHLPKPIAPIKDSFAE